MRIFFKYQLGSHIKQSTYIGSSLFQILVFWSLFSKPKICQFWVSFRYQNILGFDISMNDIVIIQEGNSWNYSFYHFQGLSSFQGSFLVYVVSEISALAVLHEQINIIYGLTKVNELDNVWVGSFLANGYLVFSTFYDISYCFLFWLTSWVFNLL